MKQKALAVHLVSGYTGNTTSESHHFIMPSSKDITWHYPHGHLCEQTFSGRQLEEGRNMSSAPTALITSAEIETDLKKE
jgi:hypothetical protein